MLSLMNNLMKEWWNRIGDAPPGTRNPDVCSISVFRKRGNEEEYLGNFAPELFVLADAQHKDVALEWQIKEEEWSRQKPHLTKDLLSDEYRYTLADERPELYQKLYREDDTRKTPFELALIPASPNLDETSSPVTERMEAEYQFRRDRQLPLPPMVSKYRVVPDYLANLPLVRNETRELPQWVIKLLNFSDYLMQWPNYKSAVPFNQIREGELFIKSPLGQGLRLNINNPPNRSTAREKILHYASQWAAIFCTLGLAVSVGCVEWALGFSAPWLLFSVISATYLANKCAKDFGFFDMAEEINRTLGWLSSKDLALGKFSFTKTLETCFYLAGTGFAVYFATLGAWAGALALPWASLGSVSPSILAAMKIGTAGFFATTTALIGVTGTFCTRYFWGLSFFNTQISFHTTKMREMADKIEAIDPASQKAKTHLEKVIAALKPEQREKFERDNKVWLVKFGLKVSNDDTGREEDRAAPYEGYRQKFRRSCSR